MGYAQRPIDGICIMADTIMSNEWAEYSFLELGSDGVGVRSKNASQRPGRKRSSMRGDGVGGPGASGVDIV